MGYRNGHRPRTLYTRVGPVRLLVPQTRDSSFSTDLFKRDLRSDQAFVLALMKMVVNGVSTRRVAAITEELCGASFSKSTVSSLCVGLDARVRAFNERRLEGAYLFVLVDAPFIQSWQEDRVLMRTVLIVSGVRSDGYREILGVRIGDGDSFATWDETFRWLKGRGLKGVACLEAGFEDAMAVMALPEKYRKRLRTTNMQERLNEEIRRRERVIHIFPNDESALRLIAALLAEQNDWTAACAAARDGNSVIALSG